MHYRATVAELWGVTTVVAGPLPSPEGRTVRQLNERFDELQRILASYGVGKANLRGVGVMQCDGTFLVVKFYGYEDRYLQMILEVLESLGERVWRLGTQGRLYS